MMPPVTIPHGFPTEDCRKLAQLCAKVVGLPDLGDFLSISPSLFISQANSLLPERKKGESDDPTALLQESAQFRWHGSPICDQPLIVSPLEEADELQKSLQIVSAEDKDFGVKVAWRLREIKASKVPELVGMRRRSSSGGEENVEFGEITEETVAAYLELTGDKNPIHRDCSVTRALGFRRPIVPGFLLLGFAEIALGSAFALQPPLSLTARFISPIVVGDALEMCLSTVNGSGRPRAQLLDPLGRVAALVDVSNRVSAGLV